jgi:hypothetical protein
MSLILDGTNGLSDVDGSASTPAIRGTDTNTGIFFPATDTIAFSEGGAEVARFDLSGNLLVATTTARNKLTVQGTVVSTPTLGTASGQAFFGEASGYGMMMGTSGFGYGWIQQQRVDGTATAYALVLQPSGGNLLVGTTTAPTGSFDVGALGVQTNGNTATFKTTATTGAGTSISAVRDTDGIQISFHQAGNFVGSIQTSASSTAYNTSSDYRLKENIAPMTGALAKVQALKPCTYTWKSTGEASQGFIAHELAEVVPDCVSGGKDAVNEDGSIKPQGIDTSFLVATLTAAIQEQTAIITDLKSRIEALEA